MGKGRGTARRAVRRAVQRAPLPGGMRAIILYSIIVGVCYLFYLFIGIYNPDLLVLANIKGPARLAFNIAVIVLIAGVIVGLRQRKQWAYPLALFWFLASILLSLFSVFIIEPSMLPAMRYLLWGMAIAVIVIDLLIVWYLTNRKQYFLQRTALPAFRGERMFVRVLGGCWIALILISAGLGMNFYRETTAIADKNMEDLAGTTIIHAIVLCDTKGGQERDICYVVLATMHPEQDLNAICSRISSDFFRFTCYQARGSTA